MIDATTLDPLWFNAYWPSFRQHAHELLAWGYEDVKASIGQEHEEEEITGFVKEAIEKRLLDRDCPRWCEHYAVHEEEPVQWNKLTGKRRKKTDITFELTTYPRPRYIFEAKRLRSNKSSRESYYFKEGLKRFLQGQYASKYLEAGMISYVQCDTSDMWVERLKAHLYKDAKEKCMLHLKSNVRNEQVVSAFPEEWVSEHRREAGNDIAIYHISFNCCGEKKENAQ